MAFMTPMTIRSCLLTKRFLLCTSTPVRRLRALHHADGRDLFHRQQTHAEQRRHIEQQRDHEDRAAEAEESGEEASAEAERQQGGEQ